MYKEVLQSKYYLQLSFTGGQKTNQMFHKRGYPSCQ